MGHVSPERFIEVMRLAALQAGAVAVHLQGEVRQHHKSGASAESQALTAVDLATQDVILHQLHASFPDVAVDAEEDTDLVSLFPPQDEGRPVVILDPIDGTLNYTRRSPDFAVMGALLDGGKFVAAVLHFPVPGSTLWAIRSAGAWMQLDREKPIRLMRPEAPDRVLVSPHLPHDWSDALRREGLEPEVSRCSAVDAVVAALGRGKASVVHGRPDRRRAIGFLVTTESGGAVLFGDDVWDGEDPEEHWPDEHRPHVVADSLPLGRRLVQALAGVGRGR